MQTIEVRTENGETVRVSTQTCVDFEDPKVKCFVCGSTLIVLAFIPKLSKIIQTVFTLQDGVFVFNGLLDIIGTPEGVEVDLTGNAHTGGLVHAGEAHHGAHKNSLSRGTGFFVLRGLNFEAQASIRFDAVNTPIS